MNVRFVFIGEGSSDEGLIPHLENLCINAGVQEVSGVAPDFDRLPRSVGRTVKDKLRAAMLLEPSANLIFIHRDADCRSSTARYDEIARAVRESNCSTLAISIVPVQETEAWLLLNEEAIRTVVGKPDGNTRLKLPSPRYVERMARPKERLKAALILAGEVTGRRLERLQADFPRHRRTLLEMLQIGNNLDQVSSWSRLRDDLAAGLRTLE